MKLFGVEFPELERPQCQACGARTVLVRIMQVDQGAVRTFVCYDCPSQISILGSRGGDEVRQL
jgi:hypothetical protein